MFFLKTFYNTWARITMQKWEGGERVTRRRHYRDISRLLILNKMFTLHELTGIHLCQTERKWKTVCSMWSLIVLFNKLNVDSTKMYQCFSKSSHIQALLGVCSRCNGIQQRNMTVCLNLKFCNCFSVVKMCMCPECNPNVKRLWIMLEIIHSTLTHLCT